MGVLIFRYNLKLNNIIYTQQFQYCFNIYFIVYLLISLPMSLRLEQINIRNLDRDPSYFAISFDSVKQHKSCVGGSLSLCYMFLVLIIIVLKTIDLYQRNNFTFQTFVNKAQDLNPLNISSANFTIVFFQITQNGTSRRRIQYSEQFQYGFNASVCEYTIQFAYDEQGARHQTYKTKKLPLIPCSSQEHQTLFCMPKAHNSSLQYDILGRTDFSVPRNISGKVFRIYTVVVQLCDKTVSESCKNFSNDNLIYPYFVFYNNVILPQQKQHQNTVSYNSSQRAFQIDYLHSGEEIKIRFMVKRAIIQTDRSIWPDFMDKGQNITTSVWFYDEQRQEESILMNNNNSLLQVDVRRSAYTHIYRRKCKKFDEMLGQIFGLIGLLSIIFFGIYGGFNSWSFQQNIRKSLQLPYFQPTLLNFYRYYFMALIYKFCYCCFKNKKSFTTQIQTQHQLNKLLDMKRILQRIDRLEKTEINRFKKQEYKLSEEIPLLTQNYGYINKKQPKPINFSDISQVLLK